MTSKPVILYRPNRDIWGNDPEFEVAKKYFDVVTQRTEVGTGRVVIPRFSGQPFFGELEKDILNQGSILITTRSQFEFIADLGNWVDLFSDLTPRTWSRLEDIPEQGPFILKGQTNSRKQQWRELMYAETKRDAVEIYLNLLNDPLFEQQRIYIRQFIPLANYGVDLSGCPISDEYRFFILNGKVIASGFYWGSHLVDIAGDGFSSRQPDINRIPVGFIQEIINRVGDQARFYVADIALTANNEAILIELNDGGQSGLNSIDPDIFYSSLYQALNYE